MREHILSSSLTLLLWLSLTYFEPDRPSFSSLTTEQSTEHYEESTPNWWTIDVWEIILSLLIFHSKLTDPRRNKLDIFNSCFDFSILIPVLTTASDLLLWLQHFNSRPDDSISTPALISASLFLLNSTTVFHLLRLTAQGFLSSQAVNKTSKLQTINIFVNSFALPFNITRGKRTLQPQLPFLYLW